MGGEQRTQLVLVGLIEGRIDAARRARREDVRGSTEAKRWCMPSSGSQTAIAPKVSP